MPSRLPSTILLRLLRSRCAFRTHKTTTAQLERKFPPTPLPAWLTLADLTQPFLIDINVNTATLILLCAPQWVTVTVLVVTAAATTKAALSTDCLNAATVLAITTRTRHLRISTMRGSRRHRPTMMLLPIHAAATSRSEEQPAGRVTGPSKTSHSERLVRKRPTASHPTALAETVRDLGGSTGKAELLATRLAREGKAASHAVAVGTADLGRVQPTIATFSTKWPRSATPLRSVSMA